MAMGIRRASASRQIANVKAGFSMIGDKELKAKFDALPDKVFKKVVKRASNRAMDPVLKSAKENAPKETGLLKKSLGRKQKQYKRSGITVTLIGPRVNVKETVVVDTPKGPKKDVRWPAKYAHLVEFGTAPHSTVKNAENKLRNYKPGSIKAFLVAKLAGDDHPGTRPQPFMRPAFDENRGKIESIFRAEMAAGVVKEAKSA